MSILNLNTPQGRGPVGKKSAKIWMGVGLLAAVLGFGSTFAANITLNSPSGTTEFGQGVSQTIYCGGPESVTITPFSTYVNTVIGNPSGGSSENSFQAKLQNTAFTSGISNFLESNAATQVINGYTGIWLTEVGSSGVIATNQTPSTFTTSNKSNYVFAFPATRDSKAGFYKVISTTLTKVVINPAVAPTPGATTPASFKLGGISISNIPTTCKDKDFVISAYSETGTATTLISKSSPTETVKEVAVAFTRPSSDVYVSAVSSVDRNKLTSSTLVTATQNSNSFKITFNSNVSGSSVLSADGLYKIIVETQEDAIG
jgi:hypothetical protein